MDQTIVKSAPYFDLDALREETSALAHRYSGQDSSLRIALVERSRSSSTTPAPRPSASSSATGTAAPAPKA